MLEEYGPIIKYIKGRDNDTEDTLSRLLLIISDVTESDITRETLSDTYRVDKLDDNTSPLTYRKIYKYQQKDKELVDKIKFKNHHTKSFRGGGIFTKLICKGDKVVITKILRKYVVKWYHTYLLNLRMDCTESTISQHY